MNRTNLLLVLVGLTGTGLGLLLRRQKKPRWDALLLVGLATLAVVILTVVFGFLREATEYELDEHTFRAETLARIEKQTRIDLPDGAKGLKFHYLPPIDPIIFAKIEIPAATEAAMTTRIAALPNHLDQFPKNFANDACSWWPTNTSQLTNSAQYMSHNWYIEIYLVHEAGKPVLYLKYFTI